jgi:biopolymer transport protein ExbB
MLDKIINNGGPTLYPLIVLSVLALAVVLERLFYYAKTWCSYRHLMLRLKSELKSNHKGGIQHPDFLDGDKRPLPRMACLLIDCHNSCPSIRNDILKREGERALHEAFRYVKFLGLASTIAPLLGLAGTVLGLVSTFMLIETKGGQVNPAELAGGIWEALLTTVMGLAIAIPCMLAYHFFSGRCDSLAREMKDMVSEVDEWLHKENSQCKECPEARPMQVANHVKGASKVLVGQND